jgi:hypothetical protein
MDVAFKTGLIPCWSKRALEDAVLNVVLTLETLEKGRDGAWRIFGRIAVIRGLTAIGDTLISLPDTRVPTSGHWARQIGL